VQGKGFWHYTAKGAFFLFRLALRSLRVILVLALLLGLAAFFAAEHVFDEERVRAFLVTQLQDVLRRPVQLGQVILTPSGLKVKDIRVSERLDVPGQHLLTSEMAVVTLSLPPLLRRSLELGSVKLINPKLQLIRDAEGKWNIADIFVPGGPRGQGVGAVSLAAKTVQLENAAIHVDDRLKKRLHEFNRVNLEVSDFSLTQPFSFATAFENASTISTRTINSAWELEGELSLAGLDWPRAFAKASRIKATVDGQVFTGQGSITGFTAALVELEARTPVLPAENWERYFGRPLDLSLPEAKWKLKLAFSNPKELEVRSLEGTGGGMSGTASGRVDLSGERPEFDFEVRSDALPLDKLGGTRKSLERWQLKGLAAGRLSAAGPIDRLRPREMDVTVKGFGFVLGKAELLSADAVFKASEDFSRLAISASAGEVSAYGFPFHGAALELGLVKGDLKIDKLNFDWSDSSVKLKARVANVSAPKEVLISGRINKVKWEDAQKLVGNIIDSYGNGNARRVGDAEWVRVFKYVIPKKFPDSVGEVTVGAVSHKNFYFENMDLLWDIRNVTKDLSRAGGNVKIGFGPGRVNDVPAVQDSHKFLKIVFLPFVYMHKMNNLSVFSASTAYPKTLDFTRIEGEYTVARGVADTRCFYVDSPQMVAYADGTADFAKERVDMTILTRLTNYRDPLPEWWVDELGRPAIGFRVKNDLNRPDLDPRLRKMEADEIEKAVAECKAQSRMRTGALEKIRRL
jgi:hypothetical protein